MEVGPYIAPSYLNINIADYLFRNRERRVRKSFLYIWRS